MMHKYPNKYKILKTKEIWEAPSTEKEKLIVLEARFFKPRERMASNKRSVNEDNNTHSTKKQNKGKRKERRENPYWMFQDPAEYKLNKSRECNGTKWKFCSPITGGKRNPGQYRVHKPIQYKGAVKGTGKGNKGSK